VKRLAPLAVLLAVAVAGCSVNVYQLAEDQLDRMVLSGASTDSIASSDDGSDNEQVDDAENETTPLPLNPPAYDTSEDKSEVPNAANLQPNRTGLAARLDGSEEPSYEMVAQRVEPIPEGPASPDNVAHTVNALRPPTESIGSQDTLSAAVCAVDVDRVSDAPPPPPLGKEDTAEEASPGNSPRSAIQIRPADTLPAQATTNATVAQPAEGRDEPPREDSADWATPKPIESSVLAIKEPGLHLHLAEADIRTALEMISRQTGWNLVVSPEVSGSVIANIQGLGPDEALQVLLEAGDLAFKKDASVTYVYTRAEYERRLQNNRRIITRVYQTDFVRASDVEAMIMPFLTESIGSTAVTPAAEVGIKSDRDNVGGDNAAIGEVLIVQDYEDVLERIDEIVAQLDVQPEQVLIEAVIIEVVLDNSRDLGVNFSVLNHAKALAAVGSGAAINAAAGFTPASVLTAGGKLAGSSTDGFAEDVHGLKFGFVDHGVTSFVRALEKCGHVNILASPRLLVLNKQRAELITGDRIGYKTTTVTETAATETVEFLNVGTQLRLRPFITSDEMIRMEIHPERSSGDVEDGVPRTTTSEVTTNILVPNSATLVIGGLMQEDFLVTKSGVPGLRNLPWIGNLFSRTIRSAVKKELIVLLTPQIWNPTSEVKSQEQIEPLPPPNPVIARPQAQP